jgi:hypothetical protein
MGFLVSQNIHINPLQAQSLKWVGLRVQSSADCSERLGKP